MMPFLLECGSMVSLMWQDYLFRLQLGTVEGSEAKAHNMFDLKIASGRQYYSLNILNWMWNF